MIGAEQGGISVRRHMRRALAILAALLALGLAVLWLRPLPPSGADTDVAYVEDPAEQAQLLEAAEAYDRAVAEHYAQTVFRRRLLTALGIMGVGVSLLARHSLGRPRDEAYEDGA